MSEAGVPSGIAAVRNVSGDAEFQAYVKMLRATRAIITVAEAYFTGEENSEKERAARQMHIEMVAKLMTNPRKTEEMIASLATLIVAMKLGSTYDEWFEGVDEAIVEAPE